MCVAQADHQRPISKSPLGTMVCEPSHKCHSRAMDIDDSFLACHPPSEKVKGSFNRMVAGAEGGMVVVEREAALEEMVSRGI